MRRKHFVGASVAALVAAGVTGLVVWMLGRPASPAASPPPPIDEISIARSTLVWVDRTGRSTPILDEADFYTDARLSPDGRKIAVEIASAEGSDIWIVDVGRGSRTRLTSDGGIDPIWDPAGVGVLFGRPAGGLSWQREDGSTGAQARLAGPRRLSAVSWHPDGWVVFLVEASGKGFDVFTLRVTDRTADPEPFLATQFSESSPMISPDGRWLAYVSDESGRDEVYVQPFPGPGRRVPISSEGGWEPQWAHDGSELFYRSGNRMMAVAIEADQELRAGSSRRLFEQAFRQPPESRHPHYDVSPDGERFLMIREAPEAEIADEIHVVLNWHHELLERAPIP